MLGVLLLRHYEVRAPVYRKAANSGTTRAGGKVLLFASPKCGALASSFDQPSAAVETYLRLAGISYEKRNGSARNAPRGAVSTCLLSKHILPKGCAQLRQHSWRHIV